MTEHTLCLAASIIFCYNKLKNKKLLWLDTSLSLFPPGAIFAVVWAPHAHFHFICGLMLPGDRQLAAVQVTNWNNNNNNSSRGSRGSNNNNNNSGQTTASTFWPSTHNTKKRKNERLSLCSNENFYLCTRPEKRRKTAENKKKTELNWKHPNENCEQGARADSAKFRVIWRSWLTVLPTTAG